MLQSVIDTGVAAEQLQELGVMITSATMKNKDTCIITWQADGTQHDVHVNEILNQ